MHNNDVTYTKAMGIMLMVLGHSGCSIPYVTQTLYTFHMPLFFFLSGFCFKTKYLETPGRFLWKRVKGLYLPYVKWGLLFLVLHNIFYWIHVYDADFGFQGQGSHLYSLEDFKTKFFLVLKMNHMEQLLGDIGF